MKVYSRKLPKGELGCSFFGAFNKWGDAGLSGINALILAAGKGTRMISNIPKVLHPICFKPMLWYIITAAQPVSEQQILVVGYGKEQVEDYLNEKFKSDHLTTVFQKQQLGTGHAVKCAKEKLTREHTLVLLGDTPLITEEELKDLVDSHINKDATGTILTVVVDNPERYGRIKRDSDGVVEEIIEETDASSEEKRISEINTGIMIFKTKALLSALEKLDASNNQGEYYLTDVINVLYNKGESILGRSTDKVYRLQGINDRSELAKAEKRMRLEINHQYMQQGVTIQDPDNTYIEPGVSIEEDTTIYPNTVLKGDTRIESFCRLGPDVEIKDSIIGEGTQVEKSKIDSSSLEKHVSIGPYSQIRPTSYIGQDVKIGNFVEVKNSTMGKGSKANHLAYIGDADIGSNVNLGAGTVIVNYDGVRKYRTVIEDNAFVGCNSNLIAPIRIKRKSFVAAGSTITEEVPENSLAIARAKQVNKQDWVLKKKQTET